MSLTYVVQVIAVMAVVTLLLRAAPFLVSRWIRHWPIIQRLGLFLPLVIMTLLLLHSLRGSMGENPAGAWQEVLAAALAIGLQWFLRRPLLSILGATLFYVALRNI